MRPNWFLGFPLPAHDWIASLEPVPSGSRLFAPGDIHVTFAFLGPVEEDRALSAWELAKTLHASGLSFALGPIRGFGNPRRPSAWSIEPDDGAPELARFITAHRDGILLAGGGRPDLRPARPHATVVRPTRCATAAERRALRDWALRQKLPAMILPVDRIALFTWDAERKERLFKIVSEHAL